MAKRIIAAVMLLVSITCVAVQYNDPDGKWWMLFYGYAVAVSGMAVLARSPWWAFPGAVVYLLGGIWVMPWAAMNADLFGMPQWHMGPDSNEEAREAGGLFLLSLWMFVVAWWWWQQRHTKSGTSEDTPA